MGLFRWLWGSSSAPAAPLPRNQAQQDATEHQWAVALEMASHALHAKNNIISGLQHQLDTVNERSSSRASSRASSVSSGAPAAAVQAAEANAAVAASRLLAALSRCQQLEHRLQAAPGKQAALHKSHTDQQAAAYSRLESELTAAQLKAEQLAEQLEAERGASQEARQQLEAASQQRLAVKQQLQAVKGELAEARQAQDSAAFSLALLDADFAALRQENAELQAMLTQRESTYLTLLETVQELFRQHSPPARSASGSGQPSPCKPADGEGEEDVAQRLQTKLQEWQRRLESAAKLRCTSRQATTSGGSEGNSVAADGGMVVELSSSSHNEVDGGWQESSADSSSLQAAHASMVQAAIEAAGSIESATSRDRSEAAGTASPGSSCTTTAVVQLNLAAGSPRAACITADAATAASGSLVESPAGGGSAGAAASEGELLQVRDFEGDQQLKESKVWRDNPLATPPQQRSLSRQGSLIKALGLRAAKSPREQPSDVLSGSKQSVDGKAPLERKDA